MSHHDALSGHYSDQRVRIMRDVEAHALTDRSGKLPWREAWAPYFGDRDGLLEALAVRRRCLALISISDLPDDVDHNAGWRLRRAESALERILQRHGWSEQPQLAASA